MILKAVECFEDKGVGCVAGRIEGYSPSNYIEEYLKRHGYLCQETSTLKHWFFPYTQTANAIYRREVLDEIGFFEEMWVSAGDTELTWRMLQKTRYKFIYCKDSLIHHVHRSTLKEIIQSAKDLGLWRTLAS